MRYAGAVMAAAGALAASPAIAQEWSVYAGGAGRIEYNDNYFFVAPGQAVPGNPDCGRARRSLRSHCHCRRSSPRPGAPRCPTSLRCWPSARTRCGASPRPRST
ncbi:MAG: hypothetical protein MZW92_70630 [Comamonadaceae bacterium]|nr:hypothetical protein [Comamonadaceae bacterium]